jgi:hypothetical protein
MKCSFRLELVSRTATSPEPDPLDHSTTYVELNRTIELPFAPQAGLRVQFPAVHPSPEDKERFRSARRSGVFVNSILQVRVAYYHLGDETFHLIATEHLADPAKLRLAVEQWVYGYGFQGPVEHHRHAVMQAAGGGNTERLRALFDRYSDVLALQGAAGELALRRAADGNHLSTVEMLLDAGVPAGAAEPGSRTALMAAAAHGHLGVVRVLIAAGASVNTRTIDGGTALGSAAFSGHGDVVDELLRTGANPNLRTHRGSSALARAAKQGHTEVVRLLLRAGADPTILDDADDTPLALALRAGHTEAAALLTQAENDRP